MSDQMTKAQLLELLRTKRAEWDATIASVPPSRMTETGVAGQWSVKDIIAHITHYESWYGDRMDEQLHGIAYVPTEFDFMDFDQRNEIMYQKSKDTPLQDVLRESKQAFEKLIAGAEAHTEAFLIEPQKFGDAPPVIIWQMLRGDVYEHYGHHIESIKSWLST